MTLIASVSQDAKIGARFLMKHPSYTVTTFLTLVLTIAAVSTMFSLVTQVLLQPLPIPNPDKLVSVEVSSTPTGGRERSESISFAAFENWRSAKPNAIEIAWNVIESSVLTETEIGVYSAGHLVSHNFLSMIGVEPLLGRWFGEADAGQPVLVISYDMWQQDLGGDDQIIGRAISLDKNPYTVIGVMPQSYLKFIEPRLRYWRPIDSFGRGGSVLARLHEELTPGVLQQATDSFNRILQQDSAERAVDFVPVMERLVGSTGASLWLLMAAVSGLFLVALLNLTNLAFAHVYKRIHELTTRASLGATRFRLIRQVIMESAILSCVAAAASIVVTGWLLDVALWILPETFPRKSDITVDVGSWAFAMFAAMGSGIVVTLIPSVRIANPDRLVEQMKHINSRLVSGFGSIRLRRHLIAIQVGVSLVLLVAVGLLIRSYDNLLDREIGFNPDGVISGHIWRPEGFGDEQISAAFDRVLREIERLPEVALVGAGSTIPMGPISTRVDPTIGYTYRGQPALREGEESRAALRTVTDEYFRVLGIDLVAGRFFDGREVASDNATIIVNQSFADTVWPEENPVGRELILQQRGGDRAYAVVGVVANYRFDGLDADIKPEVFLSMSQQVFGGASYIAKIRSDNLETAMQTIARVASQLDSSMPMIEVRSMEDLVVDSIAHQQAVLAILIAFACFATLLAGVGIYGLTNYLIGCRTQEIAIRIALGATRNWVRRWVLKDAALPVGLGVMIGLALTIPLNRVLGAFLFGVETWDWPAYSGALLVIMLIALLAPIGPAWRAARIHPNQALRES